MVGNSLSFAFTSIIFIFPAQGDAKGSVIEYLGRCDRRNIVDLGGILGAIVPRDATSFIRDTATGDTPVIICHCPGYNNDAERGVCSLRNVLQKETLCR